MLDTTGMEVTAAMAASILILSMPIRQGAATESAPCLGLALIAGSLIWSLFGAIVALLLP